MNRDESTYGGVGRKFDAYVDLQKSKPVAAVPERGLPPQRPYTPLPHNPGMENKVFMGIGVGIGATLLLLALWAFITAGQWAALERDGAAVGYSIVGFFLTVAGTGGILATLNHHHRVLKRPAAHH